MAEFRSRGLFWWREDLPENMIAPSSSVAGELSISDEGRIHLVLDGFLDRGDGRGPWGIIPHAEESVDTKARTIEGRLISENKQVFLYGLRKGLRTTFRSSGISTEGYFADYCLISESWGIGWLPDAFSTIDIDLTDLFGWLMFRPFEIDEIARAVSLSDFGERLFETSLGRVEIEVLSEMPSFSMYDKEVRLSAKARLRLHAKKEADLSRLQEIFRSLQDLFIILTDSEYCFDWPLVLACRDDRSEGFRFYFRRLYTDAEAPEWFALPTNLRVLDSSFAEIIDNWIGNRERFGPGYYLYLGVRRGLKMYTENHFWSLVTGLESFHFTKCGSRINPSIMVKACRVLSDVKTVKDRRWLKTILRREVTPRLAERITETVMSLPVDLERNRVLAFATSCAKRRNDLAHFGGNRGPVAYSDFIRELSILIEALRTLYHLLLLQEIGVDKVQIRGWLYNGPRSHRQRDSLVRADLIDKDAFKSAD